jgi:ABC-type transport system substrate-binding protein
MAALFLKSPMTGYQKTMWVRDHSNLFPGSREPKSSWSETKVTGDPNQDRSKIIPEDSTREMLLTKGEIDIMWLPPTKDYEMLNKRKNLKVLGVPSIRSTYIDMNRNMPPFDNILVRKALCYSFPYESVIKNVLHGRAVQMTSPVPKGAPSHTSEYFPFKYDLNF